MSGEYLKVCRESHLLFVFACYLTLPLTLSRSISSPAGHFGCLIKLAPWRQLKAAPLGPTLCMPMILLYNSFFFYVLFFQHFVAFFSFLWARRFAASSLQLHCQSCASRESRASGREFHKNCSPVRWANSTKRNWTKRRLLCGISVKR